MSIVEQNQHLRMYGVCSATSASFQPKPFRNPNHSECMQEPRACQAASGIKRKREERVRVCIKLNILIKLACL